MHKVKIFLCFVSLILVANFVNAADASSYFYPDEEPPPPPEEQAQTAITNGESFTGSVAEGTTFNLPDGGSVTVSGSVEIVGGEIVSADSIEFTGGEATGVREFESEGDGFTIDFAQTFQNDDLFITNGQGIARVGDIITVAHADSFVRAGATTTNANELVIHPARFEVAQADSLFSGCVRATHITNSTVIIFQ
ncbi:MAG: hypothetical protein KDD84_10555, partial [Caldilineaceae bacterium]|nr:hypothetical protein [Caldilineaceae bacterium]